jgi:hypothetical protein
LRRVWSLRFAEPIVLADGARLATLREAVAHPGRTVPKWDHDAQSVTTAAKLLTLAAEHGSPMFSRIATLQALNRMERVFNPGRKDASTMLARVVRFLANRNI